MRVDLRSDTVTKPTDDMLKAMLAAPVGDDVFGEDESVNQLENSLAERFGMEAALFCPSGTMANQIAIKCHTQPGDEVICDATSHVYIFEGGGIAFNSGAQVRPIAGNRGRVSAAQVRAAINPIDVHKAHSALVVLENTANRGGGSCYQIGELQSIKEVCSEHRLALHLDGARLFNALVATGQLASEYGKLFHSISVCLSKGLGAPVGSVLLGSAQFIAKARRVRKVFGGGMRQAGYLAAAGLYALEHHVDRLAIDHAHAGAIAESLSKQAFVGDIMPVETNIVIFELIDKYSAADFVNKLREQDIHCFTVSATQVRMVTHLDVSPEMVKQVCNIIESF